MDKTKEPENGGHHEPSEGERVLVLEPADQQQQGHSVPKSKRRQAAYHATDL